ncbi:MAG: hypothetical protein GXY48_05855 [Methanomicrobiales archaeon]|nr:hypothetical protein [Methanomicrobiales archaeon]
MKNIHNSDKKFCQPFVEYPTVPAETFFDTIHDLTYSAKLLCLISSSIQLGIFDELETWQISDDIAEKFPNPDFIRGIIECLVHSGFLERKEGMIKNSLLSQIYLSTVSPYYQGSFLEKNIRHLQDLWIPLKKNTLEGPVRYHEDTFYSEYSLPSMAENAMSGRLQKVIYEITKIPSFNLMKKGLDIGGGHGLYGIALACLNKNMIVTIFDMPGVIHITEKYISHYQMQSRVHTLGGNFFYDSFGAEYDIILSSSNPSGKNPIMLEKISKALLPGGFFVSIQPGDADVPYDPIHELEWNLWTFEEVLEPKFTWSKNKKFLTPDYKNELIKQGFSIHSIIPVHDPYIKGFQVTMLIAEKRI